MLEHRDGHWLLEGRPLEDGDLVEVRRLHVPASDPDCVGIDIDDWHPAIVFDDGRAVQLEDATDASWSRAAHPQSTDLETIAHSNALIRRREPPSREDS
jgi:hypothetical protein